MRTAALAVLLLPVLLAPPARGGEPPPAAPAPPRAEGAAAAARRDAPPLPGEDHRLRRLEFRGAKVVDALRLVAEVAGLNVVCTGEAAEREVTLYLQSVTAGEAVETLCKVSGLWFRRDEGTRTIRVLTTEEFQRDHVVYRRDEMRVFTLRHPNAVTVAVAIEDLFGERVALSLGVDDADLDLPSAPGGRGGGGGRFSRSGLDPGAGRFSRGVGGDDPRPARGDSRRAWGAEGRTTRVIEERLTPDQIERLEGRLGEGRAAGAEDLRGITRHDPPIQVTVNRQHNLVVVRTSDGDALREIADLVADLDRPTPQVLLEMKILELAVGDTFRSVFDLDLTRGPGSPGPAGSQPPNPLRPDAAAGIRHAGAAGNYPLEGGSLVYQYLNDEVRARLQLLAAENRLRVVATPLVLASNNRPARLFVGEERVLTTGARTDIVTPGTGATTSTIAPVTEVRDIGNTILIVPKINADRTVTLFIDQDSSSVQPQSATIPVAAADGTIARFPIDTVLTATLQATVVAKDDMTMAIGGLIREAESDAESKIPLLGDVPLLGFLFKRQERRRERSELVLLVRPRVLFTPAEAGEAAEGRMRELSRHPDMGPWTRPGTAGPPVPGEE